MIDSDKGKFMTLFYGAGEYYDKTISKELLKMYFNGLSQHSIQDVELALNAHMQDSDRGRFFPKIADFSDKLQESKLTPEQKAELAWAQVMRVMRTHGSYGSLKLDDKQALAAVKAFTSWKDLCMMPETKMTWAKKEFISMYTTYENTPLEMLPSSLPGREELQQHKLENKQPLNNLVDVINNYRAKLEDK